MGPYGGGGAGRPAGGAAGGARPSQQPVNRSAGANYSGPRGSVAVGQRNAATGRQGDGGNWNVTQTPGGSTIIHGQGGGSHTGPGGNTIAGGASGTAVIGPNGNVHTSGTAGAKVTTPGGQSAGRVSHTGGTQTQSGISTRHGSTVAGAQGPGGAAIKGGGYAAAVGPNGAVAKGGRYGAATGPGGSAYYGTRFAGASNLAGQGAYVRQNFGYYNNFTGGWYRQYPGAWAAAGLVAGAAWAACSWGSCSSSCGYSEDTAPVDYSYGDAVTYQDGNVMYGDQVACTEAEYADQATAIADAGTKMEPPPDEKWEALGVYAMVKGEETESTDIFQLAINKDGVLRGNYYNATTDTVTPVKGSLDRKSQRVAWTIGDKKDTTFEAGLYNLTKDESTMLVHFGKDHTEQRTLVRIEKPKEEGEAKAGQQ
jgi:hypothetical protein